MPASGAYSCIPDAVPLCMQIKTCENCKLSHPATFWKVSGKFLIVSTRARGVRSGKGQGRHADRVAVSLSDVCLFDRLRGCGAQELPMLLSRIARSAALQQSTRMAKDLGGENAVFSGHRSFRAQHQAR